MKHVTHHYKLFFLLLVSMIASMTLHVYAEDSQLSDPIIITEIMPGTDASASEEFVELFNQSRQAIDLTAQGWVLQIASSKATSWTGAKTIRLSGMFYPGTYLLAASTYTTTSGVTKNYLSEYASAQFSAGLTAASGHVRVGRTALPPATDLQKTDIVEWSSKDASGKLIAPGIDEALVATLDTALAPNTSIKRAIMQDGRFITSGDPSTDFIVSTCPTPTANNVAPTTTIDKAIFEPLPTAIDISNPSCAAVDSGSSDGGDVITPPTTTPPAILLPSETNTTSSGSPSAAIPAADRGLQSPQITELLPNPGPPRTDTSDEFVELYNPNDVPFDLSSFKLYIGLNGTKHVTFSEDTMLPAHSFKAFFSSELHFGMSNTGGKVALVDPLGTELTATSVYGVAKDDVAWALAQGTWQWTTRPSPGAQNTIVAPVTQAKKTAKTTKTSKAKTASKAASTKHKATKVPTTDMAAVNNIEPDTPLHPLTLAVVGSFALLYGAYEYRRDLANKIYQLRSNRAARSAARRKLEGR